MKCSCANPQPTAQATPIPGITLEYCISCKLPIGDSIIKTA